ncbi:hypothetical protein CAEBREN_16415 [Caenorhabditis brenneri]|uniref:Kinesin-like protein n=1 Tax=Caenorhabditis brenneri TaxID=135651 RepID=G0NG76_CAEBE|nr:hypothetical protein CAEBREN_16415 [Caenorhabditis brenneri]
MSQFIKTYGRIRPSGRGKEATALLATEKCVTLETENGQKSYELHGIFNSEATQEEVFACVAKKIVEDSAEGFNGTIFAYGQTGSGKTHTMLGPANSWSDPVRKGLIPRSIENLFQLLDKKTQECQKFTFEVIAEFVELYNEEIFDLLNAKNKVQLRDSGKDIQLIGAKSEIVDNSLDLMHVVERGWQSRSTGSTAMNNESSRSHALLIIKIKTYEMTGGLRKERFSTLNLVDLAGSERQSHTKSGGDQLKEAANINASLTVLGRCIRILSKPTGSATYVPYRDSHLTHILKNSLGGNSKTAVIVNMHPDREFLPESSSTLMFAQSCTMIKNAVTRNEVMTGDQENSYKKAIQELRKEVDETRAKAREEFAKKLDEAEDIRRRITVENDSLKVENSELRAKYNCALVKYNTGAGTNEIVSEFKKFLSENLNSLVNFDLKELTSKNHTLKLESDANEKRCHELQQELNDLRSKYQENLNTTLQMQTPNAKERRSSTRPKRRETQYKPSPARMAELAGDNETDLQLQEALIRAEQLQCEVNASRTKLEEAMEKESKMQFQHEKFIGSLQKKVDDYAAEIEELNKENLILEGKVKKGSSQLDTLLNTLNVSQRENAELEKQKNEVIEKSEKELEEVHKHYMSQMEALQKENTELQRTSSSRLQETQKDMNEKEAINSSLNNEIVSLTARTASLQLDIKEKSESLATLQKVVQDKSQAVDGLRKELNFKSEKIARLEQEVKSKSQTNSNVEEDLATKTNLIASLEKDIREKYDTIAKLRDEKNEGESKIASLKRQCETSLREEAHHKKRYEDLQKKMQADFDGYQRDIRTLKEKKDKELQMIQESLDITRETLKKQEDALRTQKTDAARKFDADIAAMKKSFEENRVKELKQQEEKIKRESMNQMEASLLVKDNKISELEHMNEYLAKVHEEDTEIIANKLGSKQQKVSYYEKIRREKVEAETIVAQQRVEIARLSKGNRESNRPVLRSRNPPQ